MSMPSTYVLAGSKLTWYLCRPFLTFLRCRR